MKLLMVAVLELAIEDYRRPTSCTARRQASARNLLEGRSRGPGGMSMLEFFFSWLNVDQGVIEKGVLLSADGVIDIVDLKRRYTSLVDKKPRRSRAHHTE